MKFSESPLKTFWESLKYRLTYHRIMRMPEKEQRKLGEGLYSSIYESLSKSLGTSMGAASIEFQCDYDGHVAFHLARLLDERAADPEDATKTWALEHADVDGDGVASPNEYLLTVVACGSTAEQAALAADASAMSAVLKIPTVYGELRHKVAPLEPDEEIGTVEELVEQNTEMQGNKGQA